MRRGTAGHARSRRATGALVAALAFSSGACTVEQPVYLDIDSIAPISCIDSATRRPLAERVVAPEHRSEDALLVFDFVRTASYPRCRPNVILAECEAEGCAAIPEARRCLRIPRSRIAALTPEDLEDFRLSELVEGTPELLEDAPDGTVMVRMTVVLDGAATSPCPADGEVLEALPAWDRERLVGCGYSCPIVIGAESVISIDLDPVDGASVCTEGVIRECAGLGLDLAP